MSLDSFSGFEEPSPKEAGDVKMGGRLDKKRFLLAGGMRWSLEILELLMAKREQKEIGGFVVPRTHTIAIAVADLEHCSDRQTKQIDRWSVGVRSDRKDGILSRGRLSFDS